MQHVTLFGQFRLKVFPFQNDMAAKGEFREWLVQNGFENYAERIIQNGGVTDLEDLKTYIDEICAMLELTDAEKDSFRAVVCATNTSAAIQVQSFYCFSFSLSFKFCEEHAIIEFKDALIEAGYTDPKEFLSKTKKSLNKIGKAVGMRAESLRKFKSAILTQQKIEFENWCQINGFGKFSQALMSHGIQSIHDLVLKSDSELDQLCKKCAIIIGFARMFRSSVQDLQRQNKKETEEDTEIDVESSTESEEEKEDTMQVLQKGEMELNIQNGLKNIGSWLSKMQDTQQKYCQLKLEDTLHHLKSENMEEYLSNLNSVLGDMKTQSPEEFEVECIFLGLCGFKVMEVLRDVEEKKEEKQKKEFEICGSLDTDAVSFMQKKLYLIEQTLITISENKAKADMDHVNDMFGNTLERLLQTLEVDLRRFNNEQNRGQIYRHASGFYDDQFIVFTLQQFITEVQDNVLASKPVLDSNHLEKFVNFIGGKSTISTESASKINIDELRHLKVHPVGLFGTKEEVIWQLETLNCISKPIKDMLGGEKSKDYLHTGVYAIINLSDSFLKLKKAPTELEQMSKSNCTDIVLFFWPDADSFTDIKRDNAASLFLRVLLEICPTVCMKISEKELDNFYVDKQVIYREEQSMGGGIQATIKEEQKNDVSYNVEKMQSFPIEKERKQDDSDASVVSKGAFVVEGAQSTIICHHSTHKNVIKQKSMDFTLPSKELLIVYIKKITQTYRLILHDGAFGTWKKASIFAEAICPELIEVQKLLLNFQFNKNLHFISEEHKKQINAVHSTIQEQHKSQLLELKVNYSKFFAYRCRYTSLAEIKRIAKELPAEKVNSFFSANYDNITLKRNFENGVKALSECIPNEVAYHSFWHKNFGNLVEEMEALYRNYEKKLEAIRKGKKNKQKIKGKKEKEMTKENPTPNKKKIINNSPMKAIQHSRMTEEEKQEIETRLARYDYTPLQIKFIAEFGRIYDKYEQMFIDINPIKPVLSQEEGLKETYNSNRKRQELELNKIYLQKLDQKMDNGCSLTCRIENYQDNKISVSINTRLKSIRYLTFTFGNFTAKNPKSGHLVLKQATQKKKEFEIHGNEELVFAYGLSNNEMVLVVSIDNNVSNILSVDQEMNKEEKYGIDDENSSKQDMWSEKYNKHCITQIFLSSGQTLSKKVTRELKGKMTLGALSEQKHYMVLYERSRQCIYVYNWKERIANSLEQLKNKTINLDELEFPDGFYVVSMCFDNQDDSLYILDSTNTIRCIDLDSGLFDHEREIVCKERYSK
ncbi:hypothetical protein RFI_29128, partial [Reticulomyxa filosa]